MDSFDYVMKTFRLSEKDQMSDEDWEYLQRFVVLLYDRCSTLMSVNKCRRKHFSKGHLVYTISPTENALKQHIRRAMLQSKEGRESKLIIPNAQQSYKAFKCAIEL